MVCVLNKMFKFVRGMGNAFADVDVNLNNFEQKDKYVHDSNA